MADIKLDLDPRKILDSLKDVSEEVKRLAQVMDESLGKNAAKSVNEMERASEKGSNAVASNFKNLGKRIKEDLKTAFDVSGLMAGLKFTEQLGAGIKEVFNLERAFDRLNTRLGLTGKTFQDFKKQIGSSVAATGQKLEDVFPGVETAASKGNVKSPQELASIAKSLGQVKAATGENTEALAGSVVEILRTQGKKVTAQAFAQTLDALQGTRTAGAFKSAGEAGSAIQAITTGVSPEQLKKMGLGTRELGGLAATASKGGEGGQDILQHILQMATQAGGKQLLNSVFGTQLFKGEKLDVNAFQKINKNKFGQFSEQVLSSATGADQAGLSRFIDSMKGGMADFKKVTQGSNETAAQFQLATNNLASGVDQFKERTKNATREVGEDLSMAAHEIIKGNYKGALEDAQHAGKSLMENKGTIAAALGGTLGAGLLIGQGAGSLLKKIPGIGGMVGGLVGGEIAKSAGVQPVYVTNASEISGKSGGMLDTFLSKTESMAGGAAGGVAGKIGKFGALGSALAGSLPLAGAAALGGGLGYAVNQIPGVSKALTSDKLVDTIYNALNPEEAKLTEKAPGGEGANGGINHEALATAVAKGVEQGMSKVQKGKTTQFSNPSRPPGIGSGM